MPPTITANSAFQYVPSTALAVHGLNETETIKDDFVILNLSGGVSAVSTGSKTDVIDLTPMAEIPDAYFGVMASRLFSVFDRDEE